MKPKLATLIVSAVVISMASSFSNVSEHGSRLQPVTQAEAGEAVHLPEFVSLMNYSQFLMAMESDHAIASGSRQAAEALSAKFADLRNSSNVTFLQTVVAADRPAPELADVIADPKPAIQIVELASIDPETALEVKEVSLKALEPAAMPQAPLLAPIVRHPIPLRTSKSVMLARTPRDVKIPAPSPSALSGYTAFVSSDASLEISLVGRLREAANAKPADETPSLAPLTSRCGKMTPACKTNQAWCGC